MSEPTEATPTPAIDGPDWGAWAGEWAELWAGFPDPARREVARAIEIHSGTRLLDLGCGTGEFCGLAVGLGADVSGIDAAEGMIEIARRQVPEADLHVGPIERLPWADDSFDRVTAFNSLQFTADIVAALGEAGRVVRAGGRVAICNWGRLRERDVFIVEVALAELQPPQPPGRQRPEPPATGEPGVLEALAREAGLDPVSAAEVDVPYEVADQATLERAFLLDAAFLNATQHSGEDAVRRAIVEASAPFRRPDGSYRFENRFRYLISRA